jgi:hypothetical protein
MNKLGFIGKKLQNSRPLWSKKYFKHIIFII